MDPAPPPKAGCNCQKSKKADCPLPGECTMDGVVYEAVVTTSDGQRESYVGLAKNFKRRWPKHWAVQPLMDSPPSLGMCGGRGTNGLSQKLSGNFWKHMLLTLTQSLDYVDCVQEKNTRLSSTQVWHRSTVEQKFFSSHCRHRTIYLMGEPPD